MHAGDKFAEALAEAWLRSTDPNAPKFIVPKQFCDDVAAAGLPTHNLIIQQHMPELPKGAKIWK